MVAAVSSGRRHVVVGLSHLTVRVVDELAGDRAEVVVLADPARDRPSRQVAALLDEHRRIVVPTWDRDRALAEAGGAGAGALAVGEDDPLDPAAVEVLLELPVPGPCRPVASTRRPGRSPAPSTSSSDRG